MFAKTPIPPGHFDNRRLLLKENEADARRRLRAFWAGASLGRPAMLATVKDKPLPPAPPHAWDNLPSEEKDWMPEVAAFGTDWWLSHTTEKWPAESMPRTAFGPGCTLAVLASLVGGGYRYDHGHGTAWIEPMPDVYERPLPAFDPAAPRFARMRACMEAMLDGVKGRAFVSAPIWLDPLTTLSLLRGADQLCIDLLERPDDVLRWTDAATTVTIETYEWIYRLLLSRGHGESGSFFTLAAEGRMEAVQCDFAVMLSPAQFETFVMPSLRRLTDYLDYSLYHLDGVCQMRFLDQLRSLPNLTGIQWNPQPQDADPTRWLDAFGEIRRRKFVLAFGGENRDAVGQVAQVVKAIGPDGLAVFLPQFETEQDARAAIERIGKVR